MNLEALTFSINVWCSNCGTEWYEEVPFKTEVKVSSGVYLHPANCDGSLNCGGHKIVCAVCGLTEHVNRRYAR